MEIISRSIVATIDEGYKEIIDRESHHNHEIVKINGVLRWKENPHVRKCIDERVSLNDLCPLLQCMGFGKNSEVYRKLYRDMGYSLAGYWEVFYWDMNNEECAEYRPIKYRIMKKLQATTMKLLRSIRTKLKRSNKLKTSKGAQYSINQEPKYKKTSADDQLSKLEKKLNDAD